MAGLLYEVLDTIETPERVMEGGSGEFLAVRAVREGKYLVVVYRENVTDGFVITAFLTRRIRSLDRRPQLWP